MEFGDRCRLSFMLVLLILPFFLVFPIVDADSSKQKILLVMDSHVDSNDDLVGYYTDALDAIGYTLNESYEICYVSGSNNGPKYNSETSGDDYSCTNNYTEDYQILIWVTGRDYYTTGQNYPTLTDDDRNNLENYLDNGGNLFITGQNIGLDSSLNWEDNFYSEYLHAYFCKDDSSDTSLQGKNNEPIGHQKSLDIDNGPENQNSQSIIFYKEDSETDENPLINTFYYGSLNLESIGSCLKESYFSYPWCYKCTDKTVFSLLPFKIPATIKHNDSRYKIVYFAFGFEGIDNSGDYEGTSTEILNRTINYLSPPSVMETTISDSPVCDPQNAYCEKTYPTINATCTSDQLFSTISWGYYYINSSGGSNSSEDLNATDGAFNNDYENVSAMINVSQINAGNYSIFMHCNDSDGHWGKNDSIYLTIDKTQPDMPNAVIIDEGNSYTNNTQVSIEFSFTGSQERPAFMSLSCDGSSYTAWATYTDPYTFDATSSGGGCPSTDGSRTIRARIKDAAGNNRSVTDTSSITLDRGLPYVISLSPSNSTYLKSTTQFTIDLADTLSGISTSNKYDRGNGVNQSFSDNVAFTPGWSTDGAKSIRLWFFDGAGNLNSTWYNYTVDDTAPTTTDSTQIVADTNPWGNQNRTVTLTCNDGTGSGCNYSKYCVENTTTPCVAATIYTAPIHVNCTIGSTCNKTINYTSNDSLNNIETAHLSNQILIDKEAPSVVINSPSSTNISGSFQVNATVSAGTGSGIDTTSIIYNISNSTYYVTDELVVDEEGFWYTTFNGEYLEDGDYNVYVLANDTLDNINNTESVTITVDNTPPNSSDNSSATVSWSAMNMSMNITCNDTIGSGCDSTLFCVDESGLCIPNITYSHPLLQINCSSGQVCQRYVRYNSTDVAGNIESPKKSYLFRIDKKEPTINIQNPENGETYSGSIPILTTITDTGIGAIEGAWYRISYSNYTVVETGYLNLSTGWDTVWDSSTFSGGFMLSVNATDNLTNTNYSYDINFTVDNTKPSVAIVYPKEIYINNDFTVNMTAIRPTGTLSYAIYNITNSTSDIKKENENSSVEQSYFNFTELVDTTGWDDDTYTIKFFVNDTLANFASSQTWFILDKTAPTTTVTDISPSGTWSKTDRLVTLGCSDNYECGSTTYCVDTENTCSPYLPYSEPVRVECTVGTVCQKYVRFNSSDGAENSEAVQSSGAIGIDRENPVTTDNTSDQWSSENVSVNLTCSDSGSGCSTTLYCITTSSTCTPSNTFTYLDYIEVGCTEGSVCRKYVFFRSSDVIGNTETKKQSRNVTKIDKSNPSVTITTEPAFVSGNLNVYATVTDTGSLLDSVLVNISSSSESIQNPMSNIAGSDYWNKTVDTSGLSDGEYTLTVIATDNVGNQNSTENISITIDNTGPAINLYSTNVTTDSVFGDSRIFLGENINITLNVSDLTNVSYVTATIDGTNYTLAVQGNNLSNSNWSVGYTPTQIGTVQITHVYTNDTFGNSFTNSSVGMDVVVVNGSMQVEIGSADSISASFNGTLNITFWINKSVSSPSLLLYVPPNNASNYTQTPYYTNTSQYNCSFGTSCSLTYTTLPRRVNLSGVDGNEAYINTTLRADTPTNDTNGTWLISYFGGTYYDYTTVKTPYLNISSVVCDEARCNVNQSQEFIFNITIDNNMTAQHSGNAYNVWTMMNSSICSNMSSIGNITTQGSKYTTWSCNITTAGNYTFSFNSGDSTSAYNASEYNITVQSYDTEKPTVLSISWGDDNVFNFNETAEYIVFARDNVNISSVWLTLLKNGEYNNHSLDLKSSFGTRQYWNLSYTETNLTGYYNITAVFIKDGRNNTKTYTPNGTYSWFEVKNMTTNYTLSDSLLDVDQNLTITAGVENNASDILSVTANITRPDGVYETVSLTQGSLSDGIYTYSGRYTNINMSGNYTALLNTTLSSEIQNTTTERFAASFGNVSIEIDSDYVYLVKNLAAFNLTYFIKPNGGDLENVSTTLLVDNETIANITTGELFAKELGNISSKTYTNGYPVTWEISTSSYTGDTTNMTLEVTSLTQSITPNATQNVTIEIINADTSSPNINGLNRQWNTTNLLEANNIYINASDNETAISNVTVYVGSPLGEVNRYFASKIGPNQYRLSFSDTNQTGTFNYTINVSDVTGNTTSSSLYEFNATDAYSLIIAPQYSIYNKGETVASTLTVKDVNNQSVSSFNSTFYVKKNTSTNTLIVSNVRNSMINFTISKTDKPTTENTGEYTITSNVSKNGNTGSNTTTIMVSKVIPTDFVYPTSGAYFATGSDINVSVRVLNIRDEPKEGVSEVAVTCSVCDNQYVKLTWDSVSQTYIEYPALTAPDLTSFTILSYAKDSGWNDQGIVSGRSLTTQQTISPPGGNTGGSGSGSGGSGGGGGGGGNETVCVPVPEGSLYGNCNDGTDNDCDGATDCNDVDCYEADECATDFAFEISDNFISIERGNKYVISGSIRNIGNDKKTIKITVFENENVLREDLIELGQKETKAISIDIPTSFRDNIGTYAMKIRAEAEGFPIKEEAFTVDLKENHLLVTLENLTAEIEELRNKLDQFRASGVDVSKLEDYLEDAENALQEAQKAVDIDDVDGLTSGLSTARSSIIGVRANIFVLEVLNFLFENKYSLFTAVVISIILAYVIMEIGWPYYKLGRDIAIQEAVQQSFIQARKETEKQYFTRKIDERTFAAIMKQKEAEVMQAKGQIKLKTQQRQELVKRKLRADSFIDWFKKIPRKIKRLFRKREVPEQSDGGIAPLPWER